MQTDIGESSTDDELVTRAQGGDVEAMDDLIGSLRPAIFRYCRFRLSSYRNATEAADDAAQETCLAVSSVLSTYRRQGLPFRAWVYAIAAHKVADSQRRYGHGAVLVDEFPELVEMSPTPEESLISSVELRAALALTELLPTTMREVLLRRASGSTAKKVGEDLGMTAGAVNVANHRAVLKLRQLADESEEYRELFASFRATRGHADRVPVALPTIPILGRAA